MSKKQKKSTNKANAERFVRNYYLKKMLSNKQSFLGSALFVVSNIIRFNILPIVSGNFFQNVIEGKYSHILETGSFLGLIVGLSLIAIGLAFLTDYFWSTVSTKVEGQITAEVHTALRGRSKSFFAENFTGGLINKSNSFVAGFQSFLRECSYTFIPSVVTMIGMFAYMGSKNALLLAPLGLTFICLGAFMLITRSKRKRLVKARQKAHTKLQGFLSDSISSAEIVKAEGLERYELNLIKSPLQNFLDSKLKAMVFVNYSSRAMAFLSQFFGVVSLAFSVYLYITSKISLATVLVATAYLSSIIDKLSNIISFKINMQEIYDSTFEMAEIMMIEPEIQDPKTPIKLKIKKGQIDFEDASFKYANTSKKDSEDGGVEPGGAKNAQQILFKNLNLSIASGERVGLVGPSGGGKSTLLQLILRFYDLESGKIKIDEVDVKSVAQSKLRRQIAYVPQNPILFHRSIGENIGYSKPKAKPKEIEQAAKKAYVNEFIETLPDGYDTLVGERGIKLSGGQRQRVAIARAILKDAPILLLDEATSALDSESEKYIQKSLEKLMKGRTTVVVAHRLSTIRRMDRIIVIDDGKIVGSGPHEELLKTSALYKKLWSHQSDGVLLD